MNLRLTVLAGGLLIGSVAFAAPTSIGFTSNGGNGSPGGNIEFSGGVITFPNFGGSPGTGFDFKLSNCVPSCSDANTTSLYGNIGGSFTIGAITTVGGFSSAPVTGAGTFSIFDGTNTFSANLTWDSISGNAFSEGLNTLNGDVNVTGVTYSGTNVDLQTLAALSSGIATLNFNFTSSTPLSVLAGPGTTFDNYSGNYAPVPEPTFYGLLGLGVAGAIWLNQRKKKTA